MLRTLYSLLLRLHPERFRKRFAQEMLLIFDQVEKGPAAAKLVADALLSLVRQWTLRSEYWESTPEQVPWSADGAPVFYTLESFKPRRDALYAGGNHHPNYLLRGMSRSEIRFEASRIYTLQRHRVRGQP